MTLKICSAKHWLRECFEPKTSQDLQHTFIWNMVTCCNFDLHNFWPIELPTGWDAPLLLSLVSSIDCNDRGPAWPVWPMTSWLSSTVRGLKQWQFGCQLHENPPPIWTCDCMGLSSAISSIPMHFQPTLPDYRACKRLTPKKQRQIKPCNPEDIFRVAGYHIVLS